MFNDELNDSPKNDAAGEARNLSRPANKINPTRSISSADSPRKPATTRAASGRDQREREGALRHAEEAWRNVLAARGISPGHKDFERGMARGMRIEAERFDNLTSRAGRRSRAKRDAALALVNQRRQIDAELAFRLLPHLAPHDFDFVAAVLHTDRVDLADWASLDDLRPAVEALFGRPPSDASA